MVNLDAIWMRVIISQVGIDMHEFQPVVRDLTTKTLKHQATNYFYLLRVPLGLGV